MLSVIIPVWNDTASLSACLARFGGPVMPPVEVIVADASSEKERRLIDRGCAAAGAHVVHCPGPSRGAQLNAGAAAATGDILVFTHADTELLPAHLDAVVTAMLDPVVLGGAFHKALGAHYPAFRWATPIVRWWTRRFGLVYGDQSIFLRRAVFSSLGGFADIPIMEDLELTQRLRRHLHRSQFILLDPPLRTSMRRFRRRGRFLTRLENICLVSAWRLGLLTPTQIHRWYYRAK
jgi:glycosyltransferase involved in cell wall biosynthesis